MAQTAAEHVRMLQPVEWFDTDATASVVVHFEACQCMFRCTASQLPAAHHRHCREGCRADPGSDAIAQTVPLCSFLIPLALMFVPVVSLVLGAPGKRRAYTVKCLVVLLILWQAVPYRTCTVRDSIWDPTCWLCCMQNLQAFVPTGLFSSGNVPHIPVYRVQNTEFIASNGV